MSGVQTLTVSADEDGLRLDRWFRRRFPELPQGRLQKLLRTGQVRLDGGRAKADTRVTSGQNVRVPPLGERAEAPPAPRPAPAPSRKDVADLKARILHKDRDVIVIDKPAGLAVQGGSKTHRHLDAMLDALADGGERPRLVHRLDKDTAGALVLGRTAKAAAALTEAFRQRRVRKLYWAAVVGVPKPAAGHINAPLRKAAGGHGERVVVDADFGQRAVTDFVTVDQAGRRAAWLALEPHTGRTHQLRVHCAEMGTPILGDGKYGGAEARLPGDDLGRGLHLLSRAIRLPRPDGGDLTIVAPLPPHMERTWSLLGFQVTFEHDPFAVFDDLDA